VGQRVASGLSDYRIRQGSIEHRTVGGRQVVSCIAEYTRNGAVMVEYLTWVAGENALAQFFAQVPPSELDALRCRLDPIIQTLKLPWWLQPRAPGRVSSATFAESLHTQNGPARQRPLEYTWRWPMRCAFSIFHFPSVFHLRNLKNVE